MHGVAFMEDRVPKTDAGVLVERVEPFRLVLEVLVGEQIFKHFGRLKDPG